MQKQSRDSFPSDIKVASVLFLATEAALIDIKKGKLTLRVGDEAVHFNLN